MATLRQLDSGKWQVQVRRRGAKPLAKSFSGKSEANRWARMVESDLDRGVFVDRTEAERITLGELIDRYLAEVTPKKKSAAREALRLQGLKKYFGAYSPTSLRSSHIAEFRDRRLAAGRAGATVVKDLHTLAHVLDVAIKDWGVALQTNPAKLVRLPPMAKGRERRLQPGEEEKLFATCRQGRAIMLPAIVRFAIETAMRLGELLSLEWPDIDVKTRVATLRKTKTGDVRQVPLSTAAMAAISGLPRHISDARVFWTWKRADSLENVWRRAVQAAGIKDLRFHDLRHEAVSRLFERGLNPMEVASISGHKTLQMLKRYTHLRAADLVRKLA